MTALVSAEVDGHRLDDMELNLFFVTLVVAGNETTRNLINHSMLALIDHPDQAQRLRDDPRCGTTGIEEMLRFGSSIHNFRRTTTRDTEIRGVPIAAGEKVVMYYASANRDEDVFADPHRFDVGRDLRTTTSRSGAAACTTASAPAWRRRRSGPRCARSSSAWATSSSPVRAPSALRLRQRREVDAHPLHAILTTLSA